MKKYLLLISVFLTLNGFSQGLGGGGDRIEGKSKLVPFPYIDYNTTNGFTVGLGAALMFNASEKDTISPSSTVGAFGMYSENKSWFGVGFGMFYLNEDRWRITTAFGAGDVRFQYYLNNPLNKWIPYNTGTSFFYLGALRQIIPNLYGGMSYFYTDYKTSSDYYSDSAATKINGIGFELAIDKRSNVSYPRNGYSLNAELFTQPSAINAYSSNQITLDYNKFISLRRNTDVLAFRGFTGIGLGTLNFNEQFIVGDTDIRGYSKGQFRGNYTVSIQGEYRWNVYKKLGLVGFVGLATVFKSNNPEDDGRILPGVGAGFRYTVVKDTHTNIGFDIAKGIDDWGFYFRFSEAF